MAANEMSKETKQLIAVGGLTLVFVGYMGFQLMGSGSKPAPPPPKEAAAAAGAPGQPAALDPQTQVLISSLPPAYNPDPFRPHIRPAGESRSSAPSRSTPPPDSRRYTGPQLDWPGNVTVRPGDGGGPATGPGRVKPEPPPPPDRPQVTVSGIIDSHSGDDMAVIAVGTETRLVKAGDQVDKGYSVASIGLDGIWLVNGKDRFFIPLASPTGYPENGPAGPAASPPG